MCEVEAVVWKDRKEHTGGRERKKAMRDVGGWGTIVERRERPPRKIQGQVKAEKIRWRQNREDKNRKRNRGTTH